jgi:acyl transferase domain-containing protein
MAATSQSFIQEPIAIIGLACRLPEDCNNPRAFWEFLERGGIASLQPPSTRFRLDTHYSGAKNPKSMASPGGMFLNADPADLDAQFFGLSRQEAVSMDPQQRQLLEVVYEGLENAGVTLENISGKPIGCFISSFACDYADIQARDPEDRPSTSAVGIGRAMLSNRLSHFLNIKGPSMTIDTACSGGLTVIDVACRYLQTREIDGAIIGGCNIYLSPEHVTGNMSFNGYASLSGRCHTFDAKADGYIKAEAANMVMIKRLDEALRDGDPIRGIIRGTATGSDGWTAGIASPNAEAQAETIRQAYANAHISDLNATNYVEFHGTGTKAGDAIEIRSVSSVFAPSLLGSNKLRIGSVKSNIGHSEPAAGLSGLIKVVLAMEKGFIPGNPTFETPNPNIDFESLKVDPRRQSTRWPVVPFRRAGVNSFGYGGSNAHLVVDGAAGVTRHLSSYTEEVDDLFAEDKPLTRPYVVVVSANDQTSLSQYCKSLDSHLSNPAVHIEMRDLAYTLSERRTRHYDRAFAVANHKYLSADTFTFGKRDSQEPRVGYAFTGQGAQWSAMGKYLIETFPVAKQQLVYLDDVLRGLDDAPNWSLLSKHIICLHLSEDY